MKLILFTTLLVPAMTLANPVAQPIDSALEKRATCNMISSSVQGCDWDPFHKQRRTDVSVGRTIHPTCYIGNGRDVSGNKKWDWIAEWGCWVSAHNTNTGCETGMPVCNGEGSDG